MWRTNLKIVATVLVTIGVYTGISNVIPQVESEVPQRRELSADVSPSELVSIGEELFSGAGGCVACHGLGTRAPRLRGEIGRRCGERRPEMSCKAYLHESLVEPRAYVVEGYQPIMPAMGAQLSDGQVWALVAYLQSQGGEVTVGPEDLQGAGSGSSGAGSASDAGSAEGGGTASAGAGQVEASQEVTALFRQYQCVTCHQLGGQGAPVAPPAAEIRAKGHPPDYVRRSILEPDADTASGYDRDWSSFAGTMPKDFGQRLSEEELETLVAFLSGEGEGS